MKKNQTLPKIILIGFSGIMLLLIHTLALGLITKLKVQSLRQKIYEEGQELEEAQRIAIEEKNENKVMGISDKSEEKEFIESIDDCQREYIPDSEPSAEDSVQKLNNAMFIHRRFRGYGNKVGWCLYYIHENSITLVGGSVNHRGIKIIAFVQDKYVLYGQGCGTECHYITIIDISDFSYEKIIDFTPYYELSDDSKWLIFYHRASRTPKESDFFSDHECEFMAKAINLNTFQEVKFAENLYFNNGNIENYDKYNGYWIDVYSVNYSERFNFLDEQKGIVVIPFIEPETGRKTTRSFDLNNNFKEIDQ